MQCNHCACVDRISPTLSLSVSGNEKRKEEMKKGKEDVKRGMRKSICWKFQAKDWKVFREKERDWKGEKTWEWKGERFKLSPLILSLSLSLKTSGLWGRKQSKEKTENKVWWREGEKLLEETTFEREKERERERERERVCVVRCVDGAEAAGTRRELIQWWRFHRPFHLCFVPFGTSFPSWRRRKTMFKFGSKRDLRADSYKCTIRLLNENEVLDDVEFTVSIYFLLILYNKGTSSLLHSSYSGKQKDRNYWIEYFLILTLWSPITLAFSSRMITAKRFGLIPSGQLWNKSKVWRNVAGGWSVVSFFLSL